MYDTIQRLYERYRMHHDMERPLLEWIGIVGTVAFPLFYLLRRTSILPQRYDDIALRAVATALCIGLALRRWWPAKLKPFYIGYSWGVVFYCLSFLLSFTSLKNQGGARSDRRPAGLAGRRDLCARDAGRSGEAHRVVSRARRCRTAFSRW